MKSQSSEWNLLDVGKVLLIFVGLIVVARALRADFSGVTSISQSAKTVAIMLFVYGLLAFLVWYFGVGKYSGRLADLGFRSFDIRKGFAYAILWLVIVRAAVILYGMIAGALGTLFGIKPPQELISRVPRLFGYGVWGLIVALVIGAFIAPVIEEMFFRGFFYPALRKQFGVFWAILVSSLVFGIFHLNVWLFVPTFLIGVVLAYLYERENSLGPPIALHVANNLISIVLIYAIGK